MIFMKLFCFWCLQTLNYLRQERDLLKEELRRVIQENHETKELIQKAKEGRDMARKEEQRLRKERDKAIEDCLRAKLDKELLEKKFEHLQKKYNRLSRVRYSLDRMCIHLCEYFRIELSLHLIREREQFDKVGLASSLEINLDKKKAEDVEVRKSSGENSDSSLHMEEMGSLPNSLLPGAPSSIDE